MNLLACNYAVARFLPYPETGEFVNVGVVLACAQTGFLDYLIEAKRRARVHDFFPELERDTYRAGLVSFTERLRHFRTLAGQSIPPGEQFVLGKDRPTAHVIFAELTRARESIYRFSLPSTVLAPDPAMKLRELFQHYVRRQFAQEREFQEQVMADQLREVFIAQRLAHYYQFGGRLGNADYHVKMPLVYFRPGTSQAERAIKPLDLDRRSSTVILEHGDQWLGRLRRLREMNALPRHMLFAVHFPSAKDNRIEAALRVEKSLQKENACVLPFNDQPAIVDFARIEAVA